MMHTMMPIPPIHTAMPFNFVLFWWMIGLMVALFLLATILWVIGSRRIAQRQSQIKEAELQNEVAPPFRSTSNHKFTIPRRRSRSGGDFLIRRRGRQRMGRGDCVSFSACLF